MHNTIWMCFGANNVLLKRDCYHAFVWKMADRFFKLSESDLNMETNLVIE